jgi:phosphoserine phosphatase/putative flippase GtrA
MTKKLVNVYDFDHTVYQGDASFDFIVFCLMHHPKLLKYAPRQARALFYYVLGVWRRGHVKQELFAFVQDLPDMPGTLAAFWASHQRKIASWYINQKQPSDIIISASPEFLLQPMVYKLGVQPVLATQMDAKTGKITGKDCRAAEKVRRLHAYDAAVQINECYSDNLSDLPMLKLARQPFVVRKNKRTPLNEHKPPKLQALSDPAFLRFLMVGGINATCGVVFSYVISLFVKSKLGAFALGYALSLIVSYFLNGVITFKEIAFSFKQFIRFCVSYIPNFIIIFSIVHVLADVFKLYSLFAYALASILAAPVTFLMLSKFTFTKRAAE